jgi:NDP-sugar pyrophosphorylase family protein
MKAVILAGGKGTRLYPYTLVLPKPLVPIGPKAVLEILIRRLRKFGFEEIIISVGYLGSLIMTLCGDGSKWGTNISYCEESEPLGTIGPLTLMQDKLTEMFLVCNGDIITDLNIYKFIEFHKEKGGIATIATIKRRTKISLGVLECNNGKIVNFIEKPENEYLASMGIYLFEPEIFNYIPKKVPFGFDDLMRTLLFEDVSVHSYVNGALWLDIGRHEDFKIAQEEFAKNPEKILGD